MVTLAKVRADLRDIKYYCARKKMFEEASVRVGKSAIFDKIDLYNTCVCNAPPRLYDIYVSLYLENNTQESLSEHIGYSVEYISKLNGQLIRFLQKTLQERGENNDNA